MHDVIKHPHGPTCLMYIYIVHKPTWVSRVKSYVYIHRLKIPENTKIQKILLLRATDDMCANLPLSMSMPKYFMKFVDDVEITIILSTYSIII